MSSWCTHYDKRRKRHRFLRLFPRRSFVCFDEHRVVGGKKVDSTTGLTRSKCVSSDPSAKSLVVDAVPRKDWLRNKNRPRGSWRFRGRDSPPSNWITSRYRLPWEWRLGMTKCGAYNPTPGFGWITDHAEEKRSSATERTVERKLSSFFLALEQ